MRDYSFVEYNEDKKELVIRKPVDKVDMAMFICKVFNIDYPTFQLKEMNREIIIERDFNKIFSDFVKSKKKELEDMNKEILVIKEKIGDTWDEISKYNREGYI